LDPTERYVERHLRHRGFKDITYEPDGNVPPDFLLGGTIAVEVRRLNQNHFDGGKFRGLEEVEIPLWRKIDDLTKSLGPPLFGQSWFVFFRFARPVAPWKTLGPKIKTALQSSAENPLQKKGTIFRNGDFELDIFPASNRHSTMFLIGGCSDEESGGLVLAEMEKNIRYCAAEKLRKVSKVRSRYPEWWLTLVDYVGFGIDDYDLEMFRNQVRIEHDWDRIVVIDPNEPTRYFEI